MHVRVADGVQRHGLVPHRAAHGAAQGGGHLCGRGRVAGQLDAFAQVTVGVVMALILSAFALEVRVSPSCLLSGACRAAARLRHAVCRCRKGNTPRSTSPLTKFHWQLSIEFRYINPAGYTP
jgi:hypothetical protein